MGTLKPGWEDFHACIQRRNLGPLLHFTSINNLLSIVQPPASNNGKPAAGLYCRKYLRQYTIQPWQLHGWGSKGRALENYICLSFHLPGGMIQREPFPPAVLQIPAEVIAWEGVCFSRTNSASKNISVEEIRAWQDLEAFENLFRYSHGDQLRYRLAEILVPQHIPLQMIRKIVLPDNEQGWRARRRLGRIKWLRRLRGAWGFPTLTFGHWQSML